MTNRNLALLAEAALSVPKNGPTPAPKRLTSRTLPKRAAFSELVPALAVRNMIDAERKGRYAARRTHDWDSASVYDFAGMANWPTDALFDALWTALSELWVRGDVRRRTWPWDEDPLALLIKLDRKFWVDTLDELEVEHLLWPITGHGPYPRAKFHRVLSHALADQEVAS